MPGRYRLKERMVASRPRGRCRDIAKVTLPSCFSTGRIEQYLWSGITGRPVISAGGTTEPPVHCVVVDCGAQSVDLIQRSLPLTAQFVSECQWFSQTDHQKRQTSRTSPVRIS